MLSVKKLKGNIQITNVTLSLEDLLLFVSRNMFDYHLFIFNKLSDKRILSLDVFSPTMKDWVFYSMIVDYY